MCRVLLDLLFTRAGIDLADPKGLMRGAAAQARRRLRRLAREEDGATAIEYGLIVGGISIAILATVFAIGSELDNMFTFISTLMHSRFSTL